MTVVNLAYGLSQYQFPANFTEEHEPTPRYGQYLITHAQKHITLVMAAMDRCFVLIRTHQHGIRAAA